MAFTVTANERFARVAPWAIAKALLKAMATRIRLQHLLFLGFTLISVIPVLILGMWVQRAAIEKEMSMVHEKHLLLAQNLSGALTRYVTDIEAVFQLALTTASSGHPTDAIETLFAALNMKHVCVVDAQGRVVGYIGPRTRPAPSAVPAALMEKLVPLANAAAGAVAFSPAMLDASKEPTIFLVRSLPGGRLGLGAISTAYLVQLQKAIAFGARGHATILDSTGRVLAHPLEAWRNEMKDLSPLYPVQEMMSGRTGVATFYSPAMKADMIAGYTSVPKVGWGVMVPQPINELIARANDVESMALSIIALGMAVAAVISWWLASFLARPIERVVEAAEKIASGDFGARVGRPPAFAPNELRVLSGTFDAMAAEVSRKNAVLADTLLRAQSASRAKSEFLANMSHEFRTPLNAVIGFAEVMQHRIYGPVGNAKYETYLTDIHSSAMHLLTMINDVLDLAKAESGRLDMQVEAVDLTAVVEASARMVRQRAESKRVALTIALPDDMPVLQSDELKLRQVMLNLLSNAVKFTEPGGAVRVDGTVEDAWVQLSVADNGVGIGPRDLERVLEPFYQVDQRAFDRRHEGTGLGLPLAKKFIEHLGGTLVLHSQLGVGTTVTIRVPRDSRAAAQRLAA